MSTAERSVPKAVKKAVPKATVKKPQPVAVHKSGYAAPPSPAKGEFKAKRIAVIVTRWNVEIVDALSTGVHKCLKDWGVAPRNVETFLAPGAFELPLAVSAPLWRAADTPVDAAALLAERVLGQPSGKVQVIADACPEGYGWKQILGAAAAAVGNLKVVSGTGGG